MRKSKWSAESPFMPVGDQDAGVARFRWKLDIEAGHSQLGRCSSRTVPHCQVGYGKFPRPKSPACVDLGSDGGT